MQGAIPGGRDEKVMLFAVCYAVGRRFVDAEDRLFASLEIDSGDEVSSAL